jgi:hypothetical protein
LEKQQSQILDEIKALGVEPGQLDQVIADLESGIAGDMEKLEGLIPVEYRTA